MPANDLGSPERELQRQQQRYTEEIDIRRRDGAGQVSRSYRCELAVAAGRRFKNAVHMQPAMTPIHYWRSITYLPAAPPMEAVIGHAQQLSPMEAVIGHAQQLSPTASPPSPGLETAGSIRKLYVSGVHCEPRLRVNRRSETTFLFQRAAAGSATSVLTCRPNDAVWFKSGVERPPNGSLPEFEVRIADGSATVTLIGAPSTAQTTSISSDVGGDLGSAGDSDSGSAIPSDADDGAGDGESVSSESGGRPPL